MSLAISGAGGFLGWHLACRAHALTGAIPLRLGRAQCERSDDLADALRGRDTLVHLAAVNRGASDEEVFEGNVVAARVVAEAVRSAGRPIRVVNANSIHADTDTAYGRGKAAASRAIRAAARDVGGSFVDVLLPNLFGEHGRPHYNSFVATFCRLIADGEEPTVTGDRVVPLLHAQRAADVLLNQCAGTSDAVVRPAAQERHVSEVYELIADMHKLYSRTGDIPDLGDPFTVDLFNTYRSFLPDDSFPVHPEPHVDPRGSLVEVSRSHGGTGQTFISTTQPGHTRGNHYHLSKFERFFVVEGQAEIRLRRLFDGSVQRHVLDGRRPGFVDMPTMWTHNITNVGSTPLITAFWADQLLDRANPDQFPLDVDGEDLP